MSNVIEFSKSKTEEELNKLVKEEGWEVDEDTVELDMNDMSTIADGYELIMLVLNKILEATGVAVPTMEEVL